MRVVFGLDDRDRQVWFVIEDVVGFLSLATLHGFTAHDDPTLGEVEFFTNLGHQIPLLTIRPCERGSDEFGADVRFSERFFLHQGSQLQRLGELSGKNKNHLRGS